MTNKNKKKNLILLLVAVLIVIVIIATIIYFGQKNNQDASPNENTTINNTADEDLAYRNITYNGQDYTFNSDITTILFMGIDQREAVVADGYEGTGGRSDCLILLLLNEKDKTVKMLDISRDSMVDVAVYDIYGEYFSTIKLQLSMQYAYGDGAGKSCRLSRDAVSKLLFNIPIDYYLSMNLDGIGAVTEALGGVTLTVPEDYTELNPLFIKDSVVTLDGSLAERFVRYRDTDEIGSNNERMERQSIFMSALVKQLQTKMSGNPGYYQSLYESAQDYIVMDLDGDTIKLLSECELSEDDYKVPGETVLGDLHDEYIVNNEELKQLIVELFYKLN